MLTARASHDRVVLKPAGFRAHRTRLPRFPTVWRWLFPSSSTHHAVLCRHRRYAAHVAYVVGMSAGAVSHGAGAGDDPGGVELPEVEVRRSARRRRTVSAYREAGRTVVLIPGRFSAAEERRWVEMMLRRLDAGERRRRPSDSELTERAVTLSERYLGGAARPTSVRWVDNQRTRWGSCTPSDGSIRLSDRLRGMPRWVTDYVLLHELAHLLQPGHGASFWALLEPYPKLERARGYLEGVSAAQGLDLTDTGDDPTDAPDDGQPMAR